MKTYEEIKERYELLVAQYEAALEDVAFGVNPWEAPQMLKQKREQRDACAELMQLRLYSPLFGSDEK